MTWYDGPTLLQYLEGVELDEERMQLAPFRMPVQWVNRPDLDFRGFAGTIAGGTVSPGDRIVVLPSGQTSEVARIVTYDGDLEQAVAGQSITLTLSDEIDVSRGDVIAKADDRPEVARQFEATLVWMAEEPMLPGRNYLLRIGNASATATVAPLKYKLNVNSLERLAATKLGAERDRRRRPRARPRDRVRPLHGEPRDRRLHPDRPHHLAHRRRGPAALRTAPLLERPLAGGRRRQARARGTLRTSVPASSG